MFQLNLLRFRRRPPRLRRDRGGRSTTTFRIAATHLPLHEFTKRAARIGGEFFVSALFSDCAVGGEHDDAVGALDSGQAVGNGDGGVVAAQQSGERGVDEGLGFGVESRGGFVQDEDVGVLD